MRILILLACFCELFTFEGVTPASIPAQAQLRNNPDSNDLILSDVSFPAEPVNPSEFEAAKRLEVENRDPARGVYENEVLYGKSFLRERDRQHEFTRNGLIDERKRWPKVDGEVMIPYIISSKFSDRQRQIIAKAFENFHETTCIRFVPRVNQHDYVHIMQGSGCDSDAGRIGGEQTLSLGPGCDYTDIAIHELNHAVGFWHEQNRPDRDDSVVVFLANVKQENRFNFDKLSARQVNAFGVEYDTDSIMHYDKFAFSRDPKHLVVMQPKVPNEKMGLAKVLSKSDRLRIRKMYQCGAHPTRSKIRKYKSRMDNEIGDNREDQEELKEFSYLRNCGDFHQDCKILTRMMTCEDNAWLKVTCRDTCGTCANPCDDMQEECSNWAANGACVAHSEYMKLYCPKSCQLCQKQE